MTSGLAIRPPDAAGEAQLVVDEVTFSYPEHPVLHGVSFAVRHGDFAAGGPNFAALKEHAPARGFGSPAAAEHALLV